MTRTPWRYAFLRCLWCGWPRLGGITMPELVEHLWQAHRVITA